MPATEKINNEPKPTETSSLSETNGGNNNLADRITKDALTLGLTSNYISSDMNDSLDLNKKPPSKQTFKELDESPVKPTSEYDHDHDHEHFNDPSYGSSHTTAATSKTKAVRPLPLVASPVENGSSNNKQNGGSAMMAKPAILAKPVNKGPVTTEEPKQD